MSESDRERRMIRGLRIHRDEDWDYSFWRPANWHRYDMQSQYGFIYSPEEDPKTGFYITLQDLSDELDGPVEQEDLPALREGLLEGLKSLPDCEVLYEKEIAKEDAIGFEVELMFTLDSEKCKRLMRLLYNDRQQFTIYGQGVPPTEYDVFHATFQYMYHSFAFGDLREPLLGSMMAPETPLKATVKWEGKGEDVQAMPKAPRWNGARRRVQ